MVGAASVRLIDVHTHVTPQVLPGVSEPGQRSAWPCMRCHGPGSATMVIGDRPFRELDLRSWDCATRIADMDRAGIDIQVLSPMPELLSYWIAPDAVMPILDACNSQIAEMVARHPTRFRGLGCVPLQDPVRAGREVRSLRARFGLSGIEIGSNIAGAMLGDRSLEPFWEAAVEEDLAVFVHALHPLAARPAAATPLFSAFALFPTDVGMAAASILTEGVLDRHPNLRLGFSHGGGTIASIVGRLDVGWEKTGGFGGRAETPPSQAARKLFLDSNVYDPSMVRHLQSQTAPGRVFLGTDYPYDIMQTSPLQYLHDAQVGDGQRALHETAALEFLGEHATEVI